MTVKTKILMFGGFAAVLFAVSGWMVLVNPDNPFTRLFSRKISDVDARIIIGPYPNDKDFRLLKSNDVGMVISLLNPEIPYEAVLLKEEKERAERFGIPMKSYPMSSILGQRFGDSYDKSADAAAQLIASYPGKVYLHCYLGMHRIQAVRDRLSAMGIDSGTYSVRQGERSQAGILLDKAEALFAQGQYTETIGTLDQIPEPDRTLAAVLLRGWSLYRLGRIEEARKIFQAVLADEPENAGANSGLGYVALREGNNTLAEESFRKVLTVEPENADAHGGLGLALYRSGRLEEAAQSIEQSLQYAPNSELRGILEQIRGKR
ncbi:MAG: tetratricopeptide repeat protein [Candidatus Aminicenantes bacterium]|nr:tetratricopeptide repeat protein [Candidatus Aminicenantes bacterium]